MTVLDQDSGPNGQVNCTVLTAQQSAAPPPFQLVPRYPTDYQLLTADILDRELAERYHVIVRCQDGGGGAVDSGKVSRVSERSLDVLVGDVNDHAPVFSQQTYKANIIENNYIGVSVLQARSCALADLLTYCTHGLFIRAALHCDKQRSSFFLHLAVYHMSNAPDMINMPHM